MLRIVLGQVDRKLNAKADLTRQLAAKLFDVKRKARETRVGLS